MDNEQILNVTVGELNWKHIDKTVTVDVTSIIDELFVEDREGNDITPVRDGDKPVLYTGKLHAINMIGVENNKKEYVSADVTLIFQDAPTLWDIPPELPAAVSF